MWHLRGAAGSNAYKVEAKMTDQLRQAEPTPWRDMVVVTLVREGINKHKARELADHFATPPQRPWVGLTDEEILRADPRFGKSESDVNPYQILGSARDLEAKLKERNT